MRKPKPEGIFAWITAARIVCAAIIASIFAKYVCVSKYVARVTTKLAEEKEAKTVSFFFYFYHTEEGICQPRCTVEFL